MNDSSSPNKVDCIKTNSYTAHKLIYFIRTEEISCPYQSGHYSRRKSLESRARGLHIHTSKSGHCLLFLVCCHGACWQQRTKEDLHHHSDVHVMAHEVAETEHGHELTQTLSSRALSRHRRTSKRRPSPSLESSPILSPPQRTTKVQHRRFEIPAGNLDPRRKSLGSHAPDLHMRTNKSVHCWLFLVCCHGAC